MAEDILTKFLDPEAVGRLMAHPLLTRLAMQGSVSGHHKSPHRGSSVEFAEYRNYVPGDDIRRLDWRVFGRTDRFYLKEFEAETNLRGYMVVDCSSSMRFSGEHGTRFDYARRLAATLSYMLVQQGDAAGLVAASQKSIPEIPARRNPAHLRALLETVNQLESEGETNLVKTLHELAEKIRPRALVMIFSDCFTDAEELISALQHLKFKKHDVCVFQLLDKAETEFRFERPVRFVDLESSFSLVTEPAIIREEYLNQLNNFLARLRDGCHELNVEYRRVQLDENYEKMLSEFLVERARGGSA